MTLPAVRISLTIIGAVFFALLLTSCGPTIPESAIPLTDIAIERAAVGGEWRDARNIATNGPVAIELGDAFPGDAIRFGFFDPEQATRGSIELFANEHRIAEFRLKGRGLWRDERIDLNPNAAGAIRLSIRSTAPIWLGPCEIVRANSGLSQPNVLVLLIDTLRQDHMSVYGYERDTTPVMREFAKDATLLTQLMPASSWTRPSVASLFTSMYPNYHGAQTHRDKLREGLPSLAASLAAVGYDTQGFMSNVNCVPTWGFGNDFARYVYVDHYMERQWEDDPVAADLAIASIERVRGRPWYFHVHFMSPHTTYAPPEPFRSRFAEDLSALDMKAREVRRRINLYDGEIANSDFHFGRILDALKDTGQYENTLIVVLSDHGEEFNEHGGWEHGRTLYEEMLRVPLIVKPPRGAWHVPGRVEGLVEMVDVAPTILDVAGVQAPERFQGRSFLPQLSGESAEARAGFAALNLGWSSLRAAKTTENKYIRDVAEGENFWFDLTNDPGEHSPLETPGEWGRELVDRMNRELVGGATGLHVMLVSDADPREATVTITCPDCGEANEVREEWAAELTRSGDRIDWVFHSGQVNPIPPSEKPTQASKRVHARLTLNAPATALIQIDMRVEGQPVNPESVFAGSAPDHLALDGTVLSLMDLAAAPDRFDLVTLPTGFGVYVWYVPGPTALTDADVPREIQDRLKALGYVQ